MRALRESESEHGASWRRGLCEIRTGPKTPGGDARARGRTRIGRGLLALVAVWSVVVNMVLNVGCEGADAGAEVSERGAIVEPSAGSEHDENGQSEPAAERTASAAGLDPAGDPLGAASPGAGAGPSVSPLVVALPRLPVGLDPLGDLDPWGRRVVDDLVFEGLVRRAPERAPWVEMALADDCHVEREQVVDCHLRRGAKFHDGSPVTPDDVVYSVGYWLDARRVWIRQRHGLATLRSVEIVDTPRGPGDPDPGRWIRITFSKPEPLALEHLSSIKVVPEDLHRGRAGRFAREPIGSGPMRVAALEQDRVVFERVEAADWDRLDRPLPAIDRIVLRAVNDGAEALTLLRRGQVHIVPSVSPAHIPVELGKPGMAARFRAWVRSPARFDVLLWNVGEGLAGNPGLRRALHLAVPRSQVVLRAHAAPDLHLDAPVDLHTPVEIDLDAVVDATADDVGIAGLPRAPDPLADVQGLVAAQALLDGLDWKMERGLRRKPGGTLRVTIMWDGATGPGSSSAASVRDAWRSIGVTAPYATAPWAYLLNLIKKGAYQVALVQLADHDDADLYHQYHSRGEVNVSGARDAALDQALTDYRAAATLAERHEAETRVAARLGALRVATVLFAPAPVMLASNRVQGIEWLDDLPRLDRLTLQAPGEGGDWQVR